MPPGSEDGEPTPTWLIAKVLRSHPWNLEGLAQNAFPEVWAHTDRRPRRPETHQCRSSTANPIRQVVTWDTTGVAEILGFNRLFLWFLNASRTSPLWAASHRWDPSPSPKPKAQGKARPGSQLRVGREFVEGFGGFGVLGSVKGVLVV